MRIGIGQDSHPFDDQKKLILGGVHIPDTHGLGGNSDGDVVYHALCNALGSAIGLGSLGTYADEMCRNGITESAAYVNYVMQHVHTRNFCIGNVSVSLEAQRPRLEKHCEAMKKNIAQLCNITPDCVGITATSGEGLTAFGRGEGIQALAIATLYER